MAYAYDALPRRTRPTNGNNTLTDYAYSLDGNVLSIAYQWAGDAATLNYTYDKIGLQTGYASDDDRFATLFNALGTTTNTPNNLNQYTTAAGQTLTYDQNGNLTGDGARTFTYDAANRLITAQAAQAATYDYDPFDRRGIKTVDGQTTTYIYDGDEVIAEYNSTGLARKYVLGPGIDQPILMESGTNRYFYHANTLGSVIALTGTTGGVEETYQYSVYGDVNHGSNLGNPYLFTGRSLDLETGLYYYRARYYDAGLRRFLPPDPIGFAGGMNLYAYVGNNPLNFIDPYGEEEYIPGDIIRAYSYAYSNYDPNLYGNPVPCNTPMCQAMRNITSANVGIKAGGTSMLTDCSATIYDREKGWFPDKETGIEISFFTLGTGYIQMYWDNPSVKEKVSPEDISFYIGLGKGLAIGSNRNRNRVMINIGPSIGTPVSVGVSPNRLF